jgi:adenylate cyclase
LFLDLQNSTGIAEQIGPMAFHRLLNRFIDDITHSILRYGGEIYKYVGDELIVTWPIESGLADARCLRACFEARKTLEAGADIYNRDFMIKPQFRAGLHCGVAVVGEMGSIRLEIVYLGDVVNTTARIQQECRPSKRWLLISGTLRNRLHLPDTMRLESIGEIVLRGKKEAIELFAVESADEPISQEFA